MEVSKFSGKLLQVTSSGPGNLEDVIGERWRLAPKPTECTITPDTLPIPNRSTPKHIQDALWTSSPDPSLDPLPDPPPKGGFIDTRLNRRRVVHVFRPAVQAL